MARSVLAVIAGYLVMAGGIGTLSGAMRIVLSGIYPELGKAPSLAFMILTIVYGAFGAVVGGYVTGVIAKRAEAKHALALGGRCRSPGHYLHNDVLGLVPVWYQVELILIVAPALWLGGWLRGRQANKAPG